MTKSFREFLELCESQIKTLGFLYHQLTQDFPGQEKRIRGVLKDLAPSMVPNYSSYTRPDPAYDAERKKMGLPPVSRRGPELAPLEGDLYDKMYQTAADVLNGKGWRKEPTKVERPVVAKTHDAPKDFANEVW